MKKKKVMDWIQRSSNEAWDRENRVKSGKDPRQLQLDPDSHLPAQQYQKQEPIYATADEHHLANVVPNTGSGRNRSSGSVPNQSWVPEWRSGATEQRYRTEPRHRVATVGGGSRIEPVSQRQYPTTSSQQNHLGTQGKDGQTSSGQPNLSTSYPTAHFEKDYYILDV